MYRIDSGLGNSGDLVSRDRDAAGAECRADSAALTSPPYRPGHRPVPFPGARIDDYTTVNHRQPRPVAAPLPSSRLPWQPALIPGRLFQQQHYRPSPFSTGQAPGGPTFPWPFNSQEADLTRAGYAPCYKPAKADNSNTKKKTKKMAEPRARVARHKGQMNFPSELRLLLLAYGDPSPHPSFPSEPLPETVRVLDEIVTDFILEMCHGAAQYASYSRRQKIKVDDFRFALRRDANKLGRVQELLRMERELKEARKAFDQNDDQVANLKDAGKKKMDV